MVDILAMVMCVVGAAFFSGSETGIYCLNRLRLRLRAERGEGAARAVQRFMARPGLAIATMLAGTNLGIYLATILCTNRLYRAGLGDRAELYAGLMMPPLLLVFAEIVPKWYAQRHADEAIYRVIWPLRIAQVVLYPLAALLRAVSMVPRLALRRRATPRPPAVTADNIRLHLSEGAARGVLSGFQRRAAINIMRLAAVDVAQAMTPLDATVMVGAEASYDEVVETMHGHRYSRIPVYSGERSNVVGLVNVIDVALVEGRKPSAAELSREVLRIRRGTSVAEALGVVRHSKQPCVIVVDEHDRAVGILTVKDLVEEIVGELQAW